MGGWVTLLGREDDVSPLSKWVRSRRFQWQKSFILLARVSIYYWWASAIIMQAFPAQAACGITGTDVRFLLRSLLAFRWLLWCKLVSLDGLVATAACLILNLFNNCYCYITDLHSGNVFIGSFKLGKKNQTPCPTRSQGFASLDFFPSHSFNTVHSKRIWLEHIF